MPCRVVLFPSFVERKSCEFSKRYAVEAKITCWLRAFLVLHFSLLLLPEMSAAGLCDEGAAACSVAHVGTYLVRRAAQIRKEVNQRNGGAEVANYSIRNCLAT
jgi:hypothetical protein